MKIASSSISMASDHQQAAISVRQESLRYWDNRPGKLSINVNASLKEVIAGMQRDTVEVSNQAQQMLKRKLRETAPTQSAAGVTLSDKDKAKVDLIERFIEVLTGKKIKIHLMDTTQYKIDPAKLEEIKAAHFQQPARQLDGWGVAYHLYEAQGEAETTTFNAQGVVRTADGQEINLQLDLTMSRSFVSEHQIDFKAGDALKDPLVINYDAPAATLTERKFSFDIDADGQADQISFLNSGSGFLALDKNSDGVINDGSELFGPQSGSGFADLAKFDADQNGWIDENDAVYNKLRIWTKDADGQDQLLALGQAGVGAIYLGNVSTDFSLKDGENNLDGQVRQTGIFLHEDGTAGTVQQVDLAV